MSNHDFLLKAIRIYGEDGDYMLLGMLLMEFERIKSESRSALPLPPAVALKVANQLMCILQRDDRSQQLYAWEGLYLLCDRGVNSCAHELMNELRLTNIFSFVSKSVASLTKSNQNEAYSCLTLVSRLTMSNESWTNLVFETDGLIESILQALDTKYEWCNKMMKSLTLKLISRLLGNDFGNNAYVADLVLRADGFRILHKILKSTLQWAQATVALRPLKDEELRVVCASLDSICIMNSVLFQQPSLYPVFILPTFEPSLLVETTSQMYRLLAFPISPGEEILHKNAAFPAVVSFWKYVHLHCVDFFETSLLHSEELPLAPESSGVPFILIFLRAIQDKRFYHHAKALVGELFNKTCLPPSVIALINPQQVTDSSLEPEQPTHTTRCAVPDCHSGYNSDTNGPKRYWKCSRCKKVRYCCKEHQAQHWPEHKKVCGK